MLNKILLAILFVILTISSLGCQTVQGLGGDVEWTGEAIQDMAD